MSTAIVMRLAAARHVPQGLAMLNAGNAIAATISAPLGSFLGDIIGWRGAFFLVVPLALLALVWQWISMPSLPPRGRRRRGNVLPAACAALRSRSAWRRSCCCSWASSRSSPICGRFSRAWRASPFRMLSAGFLVMGLAGVAGTWCISRLLRTRLYSHPDRHPAGHGGACGPADRVRRACRSPVCVLLVLWGFFGTAAPVGWGTWLRRTLPRRRRGRRRASGRRHPARHHGRRGDRRPAVRCGRLVERLRLRRRSFSADRRSLALAAWRNWEVSQ